MAEYVEIIHKIVRQKSLLMENWIGAYRLPPNLGLGVERGPEQGPVGEAGPGGGVSPIPGTTPSPGLINMWNTIKVEQNHTHSLSSTGSIKGKGRSF